MSKVQRVALTSVKREERCSAEEGTQRWSWDLSSPNREDLEEHLGECSNRLRLGVPRNSRGQCKC